MTNPTQSASGPSDRRKVLEEAADLIDGDRNETYGTPTQNFSNIAEFWTTQFRHKLKDGEEFTAADVADFMMLLKIARGIASRKRDTYVDIAGYAGCGYETTLEPEPFTMEDVWENNPTEPKPVTGGMRPISDYPGYQVHLRSNATSEDISRAIREYMRQGRQRGVQ